MKNGVHGKETIEELNACKILRELYEHRKENDDGTVHIHKIKNGHIEKEFDRY